MGQLSTVISMLHEPVERHSGTRMFRDAPVLDWTLQRLTLCESIQTITVLCWEDQLRSVEAIADERGAYVLAKTPRINIPSIEAVSAARRWENGWRGRLAAACDFDLGFHAPFIEEIDQKLGADLLLLVDPAAGLVDPKLIESLAAHADAHDHLELCFSQAAPGLSGILLRWGQIRDQVATYRYPGALLQYVPDHPFVDPTHLPQCAPVPTPLARTSMRFKLDSDRQVRRMTSATLALNGQLMNTQAEALAARMVDAHQLDVLPRDVSLELTTRRRTSPPWHAGRHLRVERDDATLGDVLPLIEELGMCDDARLRLAGVGDPLLCPDFFPILEAARQRRISICLETDWLDVPDVDIRKMIELGIDLICIHLPAASPDTYRGLMGVDGLHSVMAGIRKLAEARQQLQHGTPLIVPVFHKCDMNLGEMEVWYDQWLRALGHAVIRAPMDCAGQIPPSALSFMEPPQRVACRRLESRVHVLCDGTVVSCDQDVLGKQPLGRVGEQRLSHIWEEPAKALQRKHQDGQWDSCTLCANCKHWDRP